VKFLGVLIILFIAISYFLLRPRFGYYPQKRYLTQSLHYNIDKSIFENRRKKIIEEMTKKNMNFKNILSFFKARENAIPLNKMPEVKIDPKILLSKNKSDINLSWLGHSSFLLSLNKKMILVDPVFSNAASPIPFMIKRFQAPVIALEELPKIDYIVISHDHYDHLDMETIKFFSEHKHIKFLVPLGVGAHLEGWGVPRKQIIERDWWESYQSEDIDFIAAPAQHFSGRGLFDRNATQWASWIIKSSEKSIYFSGDSGYDIHFKEIGSRFGPFDLALVETGQYNQNWREVHMLPEESIKAFKDLRADKFIPVHWGMFVLSYHSWNEPPEKLFELYDGDHKDIIVPRIGEVVRLSDDFEPSYWWRDN
tara:strand:+ start:94493 stop:95590 length:1098 start_codon:yes stop_codon:yes gene_type:complete